MRLEASYKDYKIIGIKYTGSFDEYPVSIPKSVEDFRTKYKQFSNENHFLRAIVYEPKRGESQETGYYYIGAVVEDVPKKLPDDMEFIHIEGEYALLKDTLDFSKMGDYYSKLCDWVVENGMHMHPTDHLIEIYHPSNDDATELEINMPLMTKKEDHINNK